jgi:hypothetical protein
MLVDTTLVSNGWGNFPSDAEGLLVAGNAAVTMTGGAILENRLWGVNLRSPMQAGGTLVLDSVLVSKNGLHGLRLAGGGPFRKA